MAQNTIRISGQTGRLRAGARTAAILGPWTAHHVGGCRWQFKCDSFDPDVYWSPERTEYGAVIPFGRNEIRGPCEVVSHDPLIIEMEIPADA